MSDEISAAANEHANRVRDMFARIAARYDLLNHLLSANVDKRWRRRVAAIARDQLQVDDARILDVACGTGDLSYTLFDMTGAAVVGSDFCRPMLDIAASKRRGSSIPFVEGDALALPFRSQTFNVATIAFGLRNLASIEQGLAELRRVLRPGGTILVLEFSQPVVPGFSSLFRFYFTKLLPLVGGLISGSRQAYRYLPQSVSKFPNQEELLRTMQDVGFAEVRYENLTGGIAAIHFGKKPVRDF